jgi:hypothetical protein
MNHVKRLGWAWSLGLVACTHRLPPPRTSLDDAPPRLASAFFGLDHAMPEGSRRLCLDGPGLDGMPVTFTRRVVGPIDASAFTVTTASGARRHPRCATTQPASGAAKDHTVLLIGELGRDPADPPLQVEVTGALPLAGGADGHGLSGPVTPLAAGPTLVLALGLAPGAIDSDCPSGTQQLVVVVWAGGVTPGPGQSEEAHRQGYRVQTQGGEEVPFALGDLGDHDNYEHLCLHTKDPARQVRFAAGVLVDPRGDLNPATAVEVSR